MVNGVIDAKVAVVDPVKLLHIYGLVLCVVLRKVERQLLLNFLCVDGGRHFGPTLVKHRQHSIINIVVEKDDTLFRRADEVGNKSVGVENLSVEEDAL